MNFDTSSLLMQMYESFNRDELKTLSFDLGIDFENIPSNLGKQGEIRELILLLARQNRLLELVDYCRRKRSHLHWPNPHLTGIEQLLGKSSVPPQPYEPETILIPGGLFLMGSLPSSEAPEYEKPQHNVNLPEYLIGRYPITNAQYAEFLKQAKFSTPRGWLGLTPPQNKQQHPVINVSWFDATSYCKWLAEQTGRPYRLPTEAEWEKAARGLDGQTYPWGNDWVDHLCNHNSKDTTAVDAFSEGASPFGCQDMIGNMREWTSTIWGDDYEESQYPYPYRVDDGREDWGEDIGMYRIVRSSSYKDRPIRHRCSARAWYAPDNRNSRRGFRVVIAQSKGITNGW